MAKIATLNFHWDTTNFGAVLTAYALNRIIASLGHDVRSIDFIPNLPRVRRKPKNRRFEQFRKKRLPRTKEISSPAELEMLNNEYDAFVVGSDQVWNPIIIGWYIDAYFLTFVDADRKRIALAASFGCVPTEKYSASFLKRVLGAFTALSVREHGAESDLARVGVKSCVMPDPVFGIDWREWSKLADDGDSEFSSQDVVWYSVNKSERVNIESFFSRNADALEGRIRHLTPDLGIENWLKGIRDSALVVTDSFHATCFAIIFHRPFVVFCPDSVKSGRMLELLDRFGIHGRVVHSADDAPMLDELVRPIDYSAKEDVLECMREELLNFLRKATGRGNGCEDWTGAESRRTAAIAAVVKHSLRRACMAQVRACRIKLQHALCRILPWTIPSLEKLRKHCCEERRGWRDLRVRCWKTFRRGVEIRKETCWMNGYALMASDEIRSRSASGGAFTAMARVFLANGGKVVGASLDEQFNCRYEIVDDVDGLRRLQRTKYVKPEMTADFIRDLKRYLSAGDRVLLTGLPCQVSALLALCSRFRNQIVSVSLFCAGAPSQKYFHRYLHDVWKTERIADLDFRSKCRGWRRHGAVVRIVTKDGEVIDQTKADNCYLFAMSKKLLVDEGCFNCKMGLTAGGADLAIGDFWGVPSCYDDGKGTSAVLAQTRSGVDLVELLKASGTTVHEVDVKSILRAQPFLRGHHSRRSAARDVFRENITQKPFPEAVADARKHL